MATTTADDLLIARILKGDSPAFKMLVERYQNLVFTIACRITHNREEAEEVTQDTFVKVYNNLAGFKGDSKFSSWLYRIAHNTALTKIRNRQKGFKDIDNVSEAQFKSSILNEAEQDFIKEDINNAIAMLEPEEATIITLFYLAEQSLDEIAETLNIEANAAKVRLFRARKKLREKIEWIG